MVFWLIGFGVVGSLALLILLKVETWRQQKVAVAYQPKPYLYDRTERLFLGHMVRAVGQHVIIFGKVRLADVITLSQDLPSHLKQEAFSQISRQHLDFLLCDRLTTRVLCAIELYDPQANPKATLLRARFIDRVLKQAGVPLARFPKAKSYKSQEIESSIRQTLALAGISWAEKLAS